MDETTALPNLAHIIQTALCVYLSSQK